MAMKGPREVSKQSEKERCLNPLRAAGQPALSAEAQAALDGRLWFAVMLANVATLWSATCAIMGGGGFCTPMSAPVRELSGCLYMRAAHEPMQ